MVGPRYEMNVDTTDGKRWSAALDEFRAGRPFSFRGVGFLLNESGGIEVEVQSTWQPENVTEDRAREDFDAAASVFSKLCSKSRDFAEFVAGRPVTYVLLDHCGMGAIVLCRRNDQRLQWTTGLPKK